MVDPTVKRLLEKAIDTPVKLHLLLLFYEHPRLVATARTIADHVCRDIWSVSQALQELAANGIMAIETVAHGEPIYRYAPSSEHLEAIRRLISGYDDPLERDKLHREIRDLSSYASYYHQSGMWEPQIA